MQVELFLLILSTLFFASILAGKAGSRFGVPALLLFLGVGMLFGSDGLGIHFDNIKLAQMIGTVALSAILFSGGLDTKFGDIKPVLGPGVSLATLGVLLCHLPSASEYSRMEENVGNRAIKSGCFSILARIDVFIKDNGCIFAA